MELKYIDNSIKELRYESSLFDLKQLGELSQKNNIQMNLGIDNEHESLYLEINADIIISDDSNMVDRQIDLTVVYFFDIINDNNEDLDNIDLYKRTLDKDLPIYFNLFNETVKRITNLDYSVPISLLHDSFNFDDFIKN